MAGNYNSIYTGRQVDDAVGRVLDGTAIVIDSEMSDTSANPVENRVIKHYIDQALENIPDGDGVRY